MDATIAGGRVKTAATTARRAVAAPGRAVAPLAGKAVAAPGRVVVPLAEKAVAPGRAVAPLAGKAVAAPGRAIAPLAGRIAGPRTPDRRRASARYRAVAPTYDARTSGGDAYRRQTVERLAPQPGETIVDVGCGTGRNFARIRAGIGAEGRLIGVEPSPDMAAQARALVARHGWANVQLVGAAAEDAALPATADAVLICAVHDLMRSPAGLANVLAWLRPGGRVVAAGPRWAPWLRPGALPLNLSTWMTNRAYVTTFEGFDRPWSHLARLVPDLEIEEVHLGGGYIARGTLPASPRVDPPAGG